MTRRRYPIALAAACAWLLAHHAPAVADVLTYHGAMNRSGHYVVPALTWERAGALHPDEKFRARARRKSSSE